MLKEKLAKLTFSNGYKTFCGTVLKISLKPKKVGDGLSSCLNAWNIKQNNFVLTEISGSKKSTWFMTHSPSGLLKINQNHMQQAKQVSLIISVLLSNQNWLPSL